MFGGRRPLPPFPSSLVDEEVKGSLVLRLRECVGEIALKYTSGNWVALKNEEATTNLLWVLEGVFIHGLKNPFIKSLFRRESALPNPSFWDFLLLFSHRDLIQRIRALNYVNTDVGRGRAWIRLTLNEMSLVSYLENILRNQSYVRSFYKSSAFLRDQERTDLLKNYLVGVVEACRFDLVVDNSLLNQWTSGPLSLVGLWVEEEVVTGLDVVRNLDSKEMQAVPQLGRGRIPEPDFMRELRRQPLLGEEDALKIIMSRRGGGGSRGSSEAGSRRNSWSSNQGGSASLPPMIPAVSERLVLPVAENKCRSQSPRDQKQTEERQGSMAELKQQQKQESPVPETAALWMTSAEPGPPLPAAPSPEPEPHPQVEEDEMSYAELLQAYSSEKKVGAEITFSDEEPVVVAEKETIIVEEEETASSGRVDFDISPGKKHTDEGFQIIAEFEDNKSPEMYQRITEFAGRIANEVGIDEQQYSCKLCRAPIGMSLAPARVCYFSGNNYCSSCHQLDCNVIPSRVLLNWDFSSYQVCRIANDLLNEVQSLPLFDLEVINPKLYYFIDELAELRDLRRKLKYVSLYLQTCKDENVYEDFRKEINPREYLFEKMHLYSLSDLMTVTSRTLTSPLTKLLKFGISHIVVCKICKAKGFVCEVCRNPEVIFPFNLESTYKCCACGAVYHDTCMNQGKPCPRCERWRTLEMDGSDNLDEPLPS